MSSGAEKVSLRTWVAVFGTILGAFMAVLDIQITNSSLREITGGMAATQDEGSWISTSYLIGEIITMPLTAWLARVLSVRWYLLGNVILFLIFSGLCGLAHDLTEMIIFRAAQGFTGGVMIPMSMTVLLTMLPASKRPFGLALFGMTATLGLAIGPSIGGWLTDNYGWQMVFYINAVPGVIMIAAILYAIEAQPLQLRLIRQGDWLGIATMAIGLGSLIAFLEEGQRQDWFGSTFIQRAFLLAAIFIPIFVITELVRKSPFVNLRLMLSRNLGLSFVVNFSLGLALYGSVYLLPQYLETVQNYSAFQTGIVMIWVGLPQLLIFPFVPLLMRKYDLRLLVSVGIVVFAVSCWLNIHMNPEYGGPQFTWPNIVRALGQPFTIVPLSALATATLTKNEEGDGSALFNIARNLGGSVGTALLSTLITQREQFHDFRIGEQVTAYDLPLQARVSALANNWIAKGFDPVTATNQAYDQIKSVIRANAFVMAFNEAFLALFVALLVGGVLVWFCQPVKAREGAAPG